MLTLQKKNDQLKKILASQEFKESKSYKALLSYLVNSSLQDKIPTESSIAIDGLGKRKNFDNSTDASVRVYIHNLRKKLASYYLNEGKLDLIKISIPKGQHYQVIFTPLKIKKKTEITKFNIALGIILVVANILFWSFGTHGNHKNEDILADSYIWSEFSDNDFPVLLVFGDFFIFKDTTKTLQRYIRDFRINSAADLESYNIKNPESVQYTETELSFLGKSSVESFPEIIKPLLYLNKEIRIKLSSELLWDDITSNNIIFIGTFKTLRNLNNIMANLNSSYRIHPNTVFYTDKLKDSTYSYHATKNTETGFLKDYALVSLLPGPNNNKIIIFAGTHDIGPTASVNSFTSLEFLKTFENNFVEDTNSKVFFESIFEVQGFERTGFHPTLIHFNQLPDNFVIEEVP